MKTDWLRHVRNAVLMGLAWAVVWGPAAVLVGLGIDPDGSMDEMWVMVGVYPAILAGVIFSAVLRIAEGRRGLDELPLSRVGAWGALAGLITGVIPFTIGHPTSALPVWLLALIVIGSITMMSTASAVAAALLLRHAARRQQTRAAGGSAA